VMVNWRRCPTICGMVYQHFYETYSGQGKSVYAVN
jgi:hypothetical protein